MKFLVDEIPTSCKDCEFCAPAMMMTQLGVQKEINLCVLQTSLIPPKSPDQEPNLLDLTKSPYENQCPCKVGTLGLTTANTSNIII